MACKYYRRQSIICRTYVFNIGSQRVLKSRRYWDRRKNGQRRVTCLKYDGIMGRNVKKLFRIVPVKCRRIIITTQQVEILYFFCSIWMRWCIALCRKFFTPKLLTHKQNMFFWWNVSICQQSVEVGDVWKNASYCFNSWMLIKQPIWDHTFLEQFHHGHNYDTVLIWESVLAWYLVVCTFDRFTLSYAEDRPA